MSWSSDLWQASWGGKGRLYGRMARRRVLWSMVQREGRWGGRVRGRRQRGRRGGRRRRRGSMKRGWRRVGGIRDSSFTSLRRRRRERRLAMGCWRRVCCSRRASSNLALLCWWHCPAAGGTNAARYAHACVYGIPIHPPPPFPFPGLDRKRRHQTSRVSYNNDHPCHASRVMHYASSELLLRRPFRVPIRTL